MVEGVERSGHVGSVHEPELQTDLDDAGAEDGVVRARLRAATRGCVGDLDGDEHRHLVEHFVVAEVREQCGWGGADVLEEVHRGARYTGDVCVELRRP